MLHVRARSVFSNHYEILEGGRVLTTVNIRWFREAGSFRLDGERYSVGRRGLMFGAFFLEGPDAVLATADKPSAFFRRFVVQVGDDVYELAARSAFLRAFDLRLGRRRVGSVEPKSIFTRSARADLPDDLPVPVQVFLTWLVLLLWKRQRKPSSNES